MGNECSYTGRMGQLIVDNDNERQPRGRNSELVNW